MNQEENSSLTRRGLFAAGGACALMIGLGGFGAVTQQASAAYVRPPGAESDADLVARCNRCQRCLQVCPHNIITPIHLGENIVANGTPTLDFSIGYCDWCMLCLEACPTQALRWETPSEHNIGVAKIFSDACVAWNWVGCTVCVEECPVDNAITLDSQGRPVVNEKLCDGCGRCEQVCPSASLRAYDSAVDEKGIIVVSRASAAAREVGAVPGHRIREGEHIPAGGSGYEA